MGQKPTQFQAQVGQFLGGYLEKEQESTLNGSKRPQEKAGADHVEAAICLPGVPQQETSHDCGFFILEQILLTLQLSPKALRELATASSVEIAMLPWPSQKQVSRRKARLRDVLSCLTVAARKAGTGDVEALFRLDPSLLTKVRESLLDGGSDFAKGFARWEAGEWDLSQSESRSRSRKR